MLLIYCPVQKILRALRQEMTAQEKIRLLFLFISCYQKYDKILF